MRKKSIYTVLLCSALGAGCGGGSSSPTNTGTAGLQVGSLGSAKFSYQGTAKPALQTSEYGLSVASLAGISNLSFAFDPAQTDVNTALSYVTPGALIYEYQNGAGQQVNTGTMLGAFDAKFDHAGHMYFTAENTTPQGVIERCNYDGSSGTAVFSSPTVQPVDLDVSTNDNYLAFDSGSGLYKCSISGTGLTLLDTGGSDPSISPDSSKVAYVKTVSGYSQVFTIPLGGGTSTQLTNDSGNHYFPSWTSDGLAIYSDFDSGTSRTIMGYYASGAKAGSQYDALLTFNYPYSSHISFSPDGNFFAVEQLPSYSSTAAPTIAVMNADGASFQQIATGSNPAWSTYFNNKTFVGTGGSLATTGAGFLFSQLQTGFDSFLTFNATTPGDATSTLVSQAGGPFVYDLHADEITSLIYTNNYRGASHSYSPDTSDVLVSIDSTSGQISSVAPFTAVRGTPIQSTKGSLEYRGKFSAVYDMNGKNLAPNGASDLVLDSKHGAVQSVR